jgi:hypothetical protein
MEFDDQYFLNLYSYFSNISVNSSSFIYYFAFKEFTYILFADFKLQSSNVSICSDTAMEGMELFVGMQVDALDTSDIYCPASIIDLNKNEIKIRYLGITLCFLQMMLDIIVKSVFSVVLFRMGE